MLPDFKQKFAENTPSANQIKFLKQVISPDQSDSDEDTSVTTTYTQGGPSSSSLSSHETEIATNPEEAPKPSTGQDISTSQAVNLNWKKEVETTHEASFVPGRKDSGFGEDIFEFNPVGDMTMLRVPILPLASFEVGIL